MQPFARLIRHRLENVAKYFPAVVLTGARQTGKTTLLRQIFAKHHYVSLDLPSEAESAERDPSNFLRRHPPPVLVDEVQYAPTLFRHIKAVIDAGAQTPGQFVLTGSQKWMLMKGVAESLTGRAAIVELETLAAAEIRTTQVGADLLGDTGSAIFRGFYPALWRQPDLPREEFYSSYIATYLERDLRLALDVGNLRDFDRFMRLCAARTGQLLNKSDLARDAGISTKTASAWLSALEACNQVILVPPWHGNIGKRLMKSPKLYWHDAGMAAFLMGLDLAAVRASAWSGALWETAVCAELRKDLASRPSAKSLFFYRDLDGAEVDFVVADGAHFELTECKTTELPSDRDTAVLRRVGQLLHGHGGAQVTAMTLACQTAAPFPLAGGVVAVHGLAQFSFDPTTM